MTLIYDFTNCLAEGGMAKIYWGLMPKKWSKIWSGDTLLPTMPQWKQINYLFYFIAAISLLSIAIYIYVALVFNKKKHLIFSIAFLEVFVAFCAVNLHISDIFFLFSFKGKIKSLHCLTVQCFLSLKALKIPKGSFVVGPRESKMTVI